MSEDLSGFSLMDLFRSEAETHTETLASGLLALEEGIGNAPALIEPMMRAAHSLKGAARIVGLEPAVKVAHVLEDCFVAVQDGKCTLLPAHIDVLLKGVDTLTKISLLPEGGIGEWWAENESHVEKLTSRIEGVIRGEVPAAVVSEPLPVKVAKPPEPSPPKSDDLSGFSLIELFRSEAEGHTATLSSGLLAMEDGEGSRPALIEPMMRAAHSIKGAARVVGLEAAVKVAHVMEDCFVAVQQGKCTLLSGQVDVLLRGVDTLTKIAQLAESDVESWTSANEIAIDTLVFQIAGILRGETPRAAVLTPELPPAAAKPQVQPEEPKPAPLAVAAMPAPVVAATVEDASPNAAAVPEVVDRVVRVTAESLTRLMSLAGESLVQSRQLRPFVDSLLLIKTNNSELLSTLQTLQDKLSTRGEVALAAEIGLLTRAKTQAGSSSQLLNDKIEQFEDLARRGEDLSGRLHHEVLTSRMRPLSDGIRGFPRMVRDVSRKLGKTVRFEVAGENTGVDRDILDKLEAPLNHLIRNALDHAIELPRDRERIGKPALGTIRLEARHRAGMLQITLSDNGRGIDRDRLRAKIVERGLATALMASQLNESELLEFLFLPGFSTKDNVTEISGRGVGLDVVQNMVREVGGVVRVTTQLGQGSRFILQLPITMSVIRALLVRIAREPYAFPLNRIDRILMLAKDQLESLEGRQHFQMDGQPVGLVEACQVFDRPSCASAGDYLPVVVASDRSHRFGVVVDAFLGERDLEVRPLDHRLGKVPNINSASVLEDGWPVLILDVEDLVRSIDNMLSGRRLRKIADPIEHVQKRGPKRVLVVDDSITVRELERQLLEAHGYRVDVAVDGVDGWNTLRGEEYDLVISDVDMPRMDGIQFVTRIKQDATLRATPVVIVSYKDREVDRMRGLDAGANAYLTKSSFQDQTFLRTVVDLIGEAN